MSMLLVPKDKRVQTPRHHIDMGFINHRLIFTTFGAEFHRQYELNRRAGGDHLSDLWNNHLLVSYALDFCRAVGVRTLGEILQGPKVGDLFCSTEEFLPCAEIYNQARVTSNLRVQFESDWVVEVDYSTSKILSDTCKSLLHEGARETVLAGISSIDGTRIKVQPLIIGAPSFDHPSNKSIDFPLIFFGSTWYEIHPEDIQEFEKISLIAPSDATDWESVMRNLPEAEIKERICKLLGDIASKDWGGEIHDHFTSAVHVGGKRTTAAFLLKGPAKFEEMVPRHLGKNGDQIYRLASSAAEVLLVQHCHNIGDSVRATLRAFAVSPVYPRRYCIIDGRDTYRILKAYDLLS